MPTHKELKRAYKDPERCRAAWQRWYAANKDKVNARKRGRHVPAPRVRQSLHVYRERAQAVHRRIKYGLSAEQYTTMLDAQCGLCAICHKPETVVTRCSGVRSLSVDHNHDTNAIRGLLCARCNVALGNTMEDVNTLRAMIAYLEYHNDRR